LQSPRTLVIAVVALILVLAAPRLVVSFADRATSERQPVSRSEVRALWILRTSLASPESVATVVRDARRHRFTTLLVQVRGRADAYYGDALEPRADLLSRQPASFDPLAYTVRAAHAAGLDVHAWLNVNLVGSAVTRPSSPGHVVQAHPEWLMVPRALASALHAIDSASPAYLDRLMRWSRARESRMEGLYISPIHQGASDHVTAVVSDLVSRYALDGVHLDYVRYPSDDFDYSPAALAAFREAIDSDLTPDERVRVDRAQASSVTAPADLFPERWAAFRRSRLTALMMRLQTTIRTARPQAVISAAVVPDPVEAADARLQDWRTWLEHGLVDVVCPMMYSSSARVFSAQARTLSALAPGEALWAGIGAWKLTAAETVARIRTARAHDFGGVAIFSYDSLAAPPGRGRALAAIGAQAFGNGARPASDR
jgi:uncharacterized lipoprotein YddW (UPF0748 family)